MIFLCGPLRKTSYSLRLMFSPAVNVYDQEKLHRKEREVFAKGRKGSRDPTMGS